MAGRGEPTSRDLPHSLEAERALLGALIYDSMTDRRGLALVPPELAPGQFYEPFHQRIYARFEQAMRAGKLFDVAMCASMFAGDPAFNDLGGARYFATLIDQAPPAANAKDYAAEIIDTATRRRLINLADEVKEGAYDTEQSAEDLLGLVSEAVTRIGGSASTLTLTTSDEALDEVLDWVDNPAAHAAGVLTGLEPIDNHLGPLLPGDLILDAGRPGMGKSAKACIVARNVAMAGFGVIEIEGEMSVAQVSRRRLTATAYEMFARRAPTYSAIRRRAIEMDQREVMGLARERLRGLPIATIKRTGITLGRMRSLIMRQKMIWARQGITLGLVVVDHGGLIKPDSQTRSRTEEQGEVAIGCKELADFIGCPLWVLLQLSRKVEDRDDKKPQLSDLRDSGEWEQAADFVLGNYRDAYYAVREKEPDDTTVAGRMKWAEWDQRRRSPWIDNIFLKVREGGADKTVRLWADMGTNAILGAAPQGDIFGGL